MGNYDQLVKIVFEGILEKKGKEIIYIDLKRLDFAPCDNFIICHGESGSQVRALADSIEEKTQMNLSIRPGHKEGAENAQWVLLDYGSTVVHIFIKEARDYYKLEDLWGDADITRIHED